MYVRCDNHVIVFRINYVHSGNFSAGVSVNNETMHRFKGVTFIALCQRPGADTEETDVMI